MVADWTRDEIILACDLVSRNGWKGLRAHRQEVSELSALVRASPLHPGEPRDYRFRSPNSVQRKTFDIATQHPEYSGIPTRGNKLDRVVLEEFLTDTDRMRRVAGAIRETIQSRAVPAVFDDEIDFEDMAAPEGRLLLSRHLVRERNASLRRAKLTQVRRRGDRLACEACAFDFGHVYGELGEGYIEVHHRLPLHASGPTVTRTEDLALVCSNCHRMIHRSKRWLTLEELSKHVRSEQDRQRSS